MQLFPWQCPLSAAPPQPQALWSALAAVREGGGRSQEPRHLPVGVDGDSSPCLFFQKGLKVAAPTRVLVMTVCSECRGSRWLEELRGLGHNGGLGSHSHKPLGLVSAHKWRQEAWEKGEVASRGDVAQECHFTAEHPLLVILSSMWHLGLLAAYDEYICVNTRTL